MLEPISPHLQKLLFELPLCSRGDLRRCRHRVKRLARDLPAFDSVWLDALVQLRKLTPFQARLLESPHPDQITLGPCILVDRLGAGPRGQTFLARLRNDRTLYVVKRLQADLLTTEVGQRLEHLVADQTGLRHPSLIAPHTLDRVGTDWVLVSRYAQGPTLGELLVRRGRYPAAIVEEVGRQLIHGLAALEARGLVHGDVRLANARLTRAGNVVLVDAGILPARDPELTIHAGLTPDRCDGLAPELLGTGLAPNARSDMYAVGCLLWQLLAGRPPFPGGDPLAKLLAHQTRTIDDVRRWAPETPAGLAETLRRLTSSAPDDRPQSFQELSARWGLPGAGGRRRLAAFRRRFDLPMASTPAATAGVSFRMLCLIGLLLCTSGLAVALSNQGARVALLTWSSSLSQKLIERQNPPTASPADTPADTSTEPSAGISRAETERSPQITQATYDKASEAAGLPLPSPDADGTITLDAPGPYQVADISVVGPLSIVGKPGVDPVILVDSEPLKIWAEKLHLDNVHFRRSGSTSTSQAALLVQSQGLEIANCTFGASISASGSPDQTADGVMTGDGNRTTHVAWKLLDIHDPRGGHALFTNVSFLSPGAACYLASPVQDVQWSNCLKTGAGPLIHLAAPTTERLCRLILTNVTCRQTGSLLRWRTPVSFRPGQTIQLETKECVFDIAPHEALLQFVGTEPALPAWIEALRMTGEGSVIAEGTIAVSLDPASGARQEVDASLLKIEGLSQGKFVFEGENKGTPGASELRECDVPRRSPQLPGIRAADLPGFAKAR